MTEIIKMKCDTCGKISDSDNHYKEGWIKLTGELSRSKGKYNKKMGCIETQWINARLEAMHFCNWECLKKYNT